ncbi:MAG: PilN domain-containing protein [Patescibacteria group bacterium]|nr:PilN domain-containing protein [Patescibacteria group bacterium]
MARDLNLLPETLGQETKAEEKKKFSTLLSLGVLLLAGVGVLFLFAFQMMKRNELANINTSLDTKAKSVGELNEVEGTVRALDIKLNRLSQVFNSSIDNSKVLQDLTGLTNKDITVTDVSFNGNSLFVVGGLAASSQGFNDFLTNLLSKETENNLFKNITLKSFSKSSDKDGYRFSLSMIPIVVKNASASAKAVSF